MITFLLARRVCDTSFVLPIYEQTANDLLHLIFTLCHLHSTSYGLVGCCELYKLRVANGKPTGQLPQGSSQVKAGDQGDES